MVTASDIKNLRERTGAGMLDCKKALSEAGGNVEAAIDWLREKGISKAAKKSGRIASEGAVTAYIHGGGKIGVLLEVNAETDFVVNNDIFQAFVAAMAKEVVETKPADLDAFMAQPFSGDGELTIDQYRSTIIEKIGENIKISRIQLLEKRANTSVGLYSHMGGKIVSFVELEGADSQDQLARDIAMHVAAINPTCIDESGVPAETLERERRIFAEQAAESGKPPEIVEKMVNGRVAKFLKEITLVGQPFVKDDKVSVGKLLDGAGARVTSFVRFEVGEGIEKKEENFADEVMKQIEDAKKQESA